MRTRRIGSLEVSVVGLGCNNFGSRCDAGRTAEVVAAALDSGITFFDTADIYGGTLSEEFLGRALGARRDDVVIATKFGGRIGDDSDTGGASARWVARAVEDSLRRLATDHIDLYQVHVYDESVPMDETLEALDGLVRGGRVREIGCSNFDAKRVDEAAEIAAERGWARYASVQNQYNLLHRDPEADVLPACERLGLGFLPYFPLASGFLTGKYRRGEPLPEGTRLASIPTERSVRLVNDGNFDVIEGLEAFAAERGRSLLELAIAWLAAKPAVASVIAGATAPGQARANATAADWALAPDEVAAVDALTGG